MFKYLEVFREANNILGGGGEVKNEAHTSPIKVLLTSTLGGSLSSMKQIVNHIYRAVFTSGHQFNGAEAHLL